MTTPVLITLIICGTIIVLASLVTLLVLKFDDVASDAFKDPGA